MPAPAIGVRPGWAPGPSAQIDWSHPLAQGLRFLVVPNVAGANDLVAGARPATLTATLGRAGTQYAARSMSTSSGNYADYGNIVTVTRWTCLVVGRITANAISPSPGTLIIKANTGADTFTYYLGIKTSTSQLEAGLRDTSNTYAVTTPYTLTLNRDYVLAGTYDGANVAAWVDGLRVATVANTVGPATSPSVFGINRYGSTSAGSADIALAAVWGRALGAAEHAALTADPFQFLRF